MKTYFGTKTVVVLTTNDFKEEIRFGYGADILLIPKNIDKEKLKHIEVELQALQYRRGEVINY